jgi:hypothetical protein
MLFAVLVATLLQAHVGKALSDAIAHRSSHGIALLEKTAQRIDARGVSDAEGIYKVAQACAALGDKMSALRVLRRIGRGRLLLLPLFCE